MKIKNLVSHNIKNLNASISHNNSYGIAGLSGSGKTTFCSAISDESKKRIITLLPKSEYQFLFSDVLKSNFSTQSIEDMPLVLFLDRSSISSNPRSTIGTHTGIFKEIRDIFSNLHNTSPEFFSFNNGMSWCKECKGRGYTRKNVCPKCGGNRFKSDILNYTIDISNKKLNIVDVNNMSIETLLEIHDDLKISSQKQKLMKNMINMNIGYLTLNRIMGTLSGGELTRLFLSEFMTLSENALIIIDEVSVGLDHDTLLKILNEVENIGHKNQIWLIDHSDTVLNITSEKLFFGPESGKYGGKIVEKSPRPEPIYFDINKLEPSNYYEFKDLNCRNIAIPTLKIPKNRLISITGESGCGKSTLINECITKDFTKRYKSDKLVLVGQDRNQSITKRSTIATFLEIKKKLLKYEDEIFKKSIEDIIIDLPKDDIPYKKLNLLVKLGLGYLNLDRQTKTLSTGEFQCVHLVSELFEGSKDLHTLFIFDEPSKGLSQNILNQFIDSVREILKDETVTIMMIEHTKYMLLNSDYIMDFGKRTSNQIKELNITKNEHYNGFDKFNVEYLNEHINSKIQTKNNIEYIENNQEQYFKNAENVFKGGALKNLSPLARVVYFNYSSNSIAPVIAIDMEKHLYSENTFLYEIGGLINNIITSNSKNFETDSFDFYSSDNHCPCCDGRRVFEDFDINTILKNGDSNFWDGMLYPEVMEVLEYYGHQKLKFLFGEIEKELGQDISKSFNSMNDDEKHTFLYGYWNKPFYNKEAKSSQIWEGAIYIIGRYIVISKSQIKEDLKNSKHVITCPSCKGTVLNHNKPLKFGEVDIRELIQKPLSEVENIVGKLPSISMVKEILGDNTKLVDDVSILPRDTQVKLKLFELKMNSFYGFEITLNNVLPFWNDIKDSILEISKNNKVIICDFPNIKETRKDIIEKYFSNGKYKKLVYVYEIFGFKKIITEINKVKSSNKCPYCEGKGIIPEDNLYEGVSKLSIPCISCHESGISPEGLSKTVNDIEVLTWVTGSVKDVINDESLSDDVLNIKISSRIRELNKKDMMSLVNIMNI